METNRKLIDTWIDTLSNLLKYINKFGNNIIVDNIKSLKSYRRSLDYYNELELDLPQWLERDIEKFFVELEKLSLRPEDYRR